ncbi:TPA: hypothetical protein ACIS4C_003688 [Salmonella enterica subsp. enterica serovar Java]
MTVLNKTRTGRLENSQLAEMTTPDCAFFIAGADIVAMAREIREYRQRIAEPLGYSAEDREALLRMAEHLMQHGRIDTCGQEELLREIGAVALRTLSARQCRTKPPVSLRVLSMYATTMLAGCVMFWNRMLSGGICSLPRSTWRTVTTLPWHLVIVLPGTRRLCLQPGTTS